MLSRYVTKLNSIDMWTEGVNEFWRRDDEERVRQQWVMQRPSIVEVGYLSTDYYVMKLSSR